MRKLITFFAGLILMVLICAILAMSGAIYDTAGKSSVEPYFFQIANQPTRRVGVPASPTDLGDTKLRNMLIQKYITELFYVLPDTANIDARMAGQSGLRRMSTATSFEKWKTQIAPDIQALASDRVLRTVEIDANAIFKSDDSKYTTVPYILYTWYTPNDLRARPEITHGIILLDIFFEPTLRESDKSVEHILESGGDPATVFRFGVFDFVLE